VLESCWAYHVRVVSRVQAAPQRSAYGRQRLQDAEKKGSVKVLLQSNVKKIEPNKIVLDQAGKIMEIKNDAVIVSAGGVLPTPFLKEIGIMVETKYGTA